MRTKEEVLESLKSKGYRLTNIRLKLIELICFEHRPLTVSEMLAALSIDKPSINKTTVYREIEVLLSEDLLDAVDFGDDQHRYELKHDMHHHHLICTKCDQIDDVVMNGDLGLFEKGISLKKGFQVSSHKLEFFGVCSSCREDA